MSNPRAIIIANATPTPMPIFAPVERPDEGSTVIVEAGASVGGIGEEVDGDTAEPDGVVPPATPVKVAVPLVAAAVLELKLPVVNPTSAVLGSGPRFPNTPSTIGASLIW